MAPRAFLLRLQPAHAIVIAGGGFSRDHPWIRSRSQQIRAITAVLQRASGSVNANNSIELVHNFYFRARSTASNFSDTFPATSLKTEL